MMLPAQKTVCVREDGMETLLENQFLYCEMIVHGVRPGEWRQWCKKLHAEHDSRYKQQKASAGRSRAQQLEDGPKSSQNAAEFRKKRHTKQPNERQTTQSDVLRELNQEEENFRAEQPNTNGYQNMLSIALHPEAPNRNNLRIVLPKHANPRQKPQRAISVSRPCAIAITFAKAHE